jgi:hypothetical protein
MKYMMAHLKRQLSLAFGWSPGNPQTLPSVRIGLFALTGPAEKGERNAILCNTINVPHQWVGTRF